MSSKGSLHVLRVSITFHPTHRRGPHGPGKAATVISSRPAYSALLSGIWGTNGQSRPRGPASLSPPLLTGSPSREAKPRPPGHLRGEHALGQEDTAQEQHFPESVQSKHSWKEESQLLSAKGREAAWQDPQSTELIRKSRGLETFSGCTPP